MTLNWVDMIIGAVLLYELYRGWQAGFIALGVSLVSFFLALWAAVYLQNPAAEFFSSKFGIAPVWSSLLAYVAVIGACQMIFFQILSFFVSKVPKKIEESPINGLFGALVSGINVVTFIGVILVLLLAIPLRGTVQDDIRNSSIGGAIIRFFDEHGGALKQTMGQVEKTAQKFLTIMPDSGDTLTLDVAPEAKDLEINDTAERELLALVNKEREAVGAPSLTVDIRIVSVAREHSRDMFLRRYFSHVSPEGKDLGVRLSDAAIGYTLAGENIAFAPNVKTAHEGLMNSPKHRENILDPKFRHIGIGIMSTSKYGMMVTQDFLN